jgi:hypothetical protein
MGTQPQHFHNIKSLFIISLNKILCWILLNEINNFRKMHINVDDNEREGGVTMTKVQDNHISRDRERDMRP